MYKPITDQEAKAIIDRHFTRTDKNLVDAVMQRAGIVEKAAAEKDKDIADGMRALWVERADGAEPFMGGDE